MEKLEEGLKETLAEGEVGEVEEETVIEIEDVCIGEVISHIYPQKSMSSSPFSLMTRMTKTCRTHDSGVESLPHSFKGGR